MLNIPKRSILDVWQGFEYASESYCPVYSRIHVEYEDLSENLLGTRRKLNLHKTFKRRPVSREFLKFWYGLFLIYE